MELKTWLDLEYGRVTKLAKAIGVPPSFVSNMANGVKPVPIERCSQIEQYTEGVVTCEELRPDLVEEFAYMRHRPEPEMTVQAVVVAGDALGYNGLNDVATDPVEKAVVMGCDVTPKGVVCSGHLIDEINTKEI